MEWFQPRTVAIEIGANPVGGFLQNILWAGNAYPQGMENIWDINVQIVAKESIRKYQNGVHIAADNTNLELGLKLDFPKES